MTTSDDDELDELFNQLDRDRKAADARVQPWQASIGPGDYFRKETDLGFHIYGKVQPDPEDRPSTLGFFRFVRAYSVACPHGELGDAHVSTIERLLDENEFRKAEKWGWKSEPAREDYLRRYPRLCAHIICESLGYATPTKAAMILKDAAEGKENWCEWVYSCYDKNPRIPVEQAIRRRHNHTGYMADYRRAFSLVERANETGKEPLLGSWF